MDFLFANYFVLIPSERKNVVSWKSFISLRIRHPKAKRNDKEKQMWLGKLVSFSASPFSSKIMFLIIAKCVLGIFFFIIKTPSARTKHSEKKEK